jgi:polysaccharide chain length determinant protein (PEP-CTERM system associated)
VAAVTNTLASSYVEENLRARERLAGGTTEFLRAQLDQAKKRLDDQERRVSDLRGRHVGELPQQMQGNLSRLESMTAQLRLNSDSQVRLVERRETLAAQLVQAQTESGSEPDEVRLQRLKGELANLRIKYTDLWPDIIRLKDEIANLEKKIAEPKPKKPLDEVAPTPQGLRLREALKSTETEIALLKSEGQRLHQDIARFQVRIDNAPRREQEFADLTRDYDAAKEASLSLVKRYEEAQLGEIMEQRQKGEQFRLMEPALPSYTPAAPNRLRLLMVSLALSLALAVGSVVVAEVLDTSFHAVDTLRAFSTLPVLVAIPRITTEADTRKRRRRFRLAAAGVLVGLCLVAGGSYFFASGNESLTNLLSPAKDRS